MGRIFKRGQRQERSFWGITGAQDLIPPDRLSGSINRPYINTDDALRHSAVWAAIRLRADLLSTLPLDCYRYENGLQVPAVPPRVINFPGGDKVDSQEWLYSSQVELDRSGNNIGIIKDVDRDNYPTRIDLQPTSVCTLKYKDGEPFKWRIADKEYNLDEVWHEKQYTVSGLHVGLSPVAYAAWQLGEYQSVLEFARSWFSNSAVPRIHLKNTQRKVSPVEAVHVKESFRASKVSGEPFVHGNDWELSFLTAQQNAADYVNLKKFSIAEIARFFNVPADLIDGSVSGTADTYANISQRNLQFLIMHLGPTVVRRERALSRLIPGGRFVKFNTEALLRLDSKTRSEMLDTQLRNHSITVSEARALDNRPPLDMSQLAEVMTHFPPKSAASGAAAN
jgi:HK97 family phage portal protein